MADKILGTTGDSGLGANRRGRTPTYQGGSTRLNTGGAMQGLSLGSGIIAAGAAGSSKAPVLHANQILPFLENTPTANGPLITEEAASRGLTRLAGAVEKYTDNINNLKSKQANMELEQKYAAMFNGSEGKNNGYLGKQGLDAQGSFSSFSTALDEEMNNALSKLNPGARQKSAMAMMALRGQYIKAASQHSVAETKKFGEDQVTLEREVIEASIANDPTTAIGGWTTDANGKKVFTPGVAKQRLYGTFKAGEADKADKAWQDMVINAAQAIYDKDPGKLNKGGEWEIGDGVENVKAFMATVAGAELSGDNFNKLQGKLIAWEDDQTRKYNSNLKLAEANEVKAHTRISNTNYVNAVVALTDPNKKKVSREDAAELVKAGAMTVPQFNAYNTMLRRDAKVGGGGGAKDFKAFNKFNAEITSLRGSNGIRSDGSALGVAIVEANLDSAMTYKLLGNLSTQTDDVMADNRERALVHIDNLIAPTYRPFEDGESGNFMTVGRAKTTIEEELTTEAVDMYDDLVWKSELTHAEALEKVKKRFDDGTEYFSKLPTIPGYSKPRRMDGYNRVVKMVRNASENGTISPTDLATTRKILVQYRDYFDYHAPKNDINVLKESAPNPNAKK